MELFLEKKRNEYHQGLSTSKVFVSEQGKILFLDPFFDFSCNTPYAKNMLGLAKNCLPPELMNCLKNYNPNPPIDPIKTEAWTIGLILLCMATLTVEHDYYDFESSKVLTNRINSSISSLGSRYSPLFKELLVSCLEVNPSRRASMAMIKEYLVMRSRL
jgi:serine/threonine protein kinase